MVHQNDKGLIASPLSNKWLVGQAVKTPASHAGDGSSILPRVIIDSALTILGRTNDTSCSFNMACIFFYNMDH